MKILSYLFLSMLVLAPFAHAEESGSSLTRSHEKVLETSIRLAGKGIRDKKTGDSLALSCVGKFDASGSHGCDEMRFVFWDHISKETYYVSPVIQFPNSSDLKSVHRELKAYIEAEKTKDPNYKRKEDFNANLTFIGGPSALMGLNAMIQAGLLVSPLSQYIAVGIVIGAIIYFWQPSSQKLLISSGEGIIAHYSTDQSGWNWAETSRGIRSKKFKKFVQIFNL